MACSLPGSSIHGIFQAKYWSGLPFPSPGDLPDPGIEPAATAAKSLQSCPTLCDPIDGSPPGSTAPGILQARTLEWVAISFSKLYYELSFIFTFLLCPFLPIHFSNLAVGVRKLLGRTPTFTNPYIAGISLTEKLL